MEKHYQPDLFASRVPAWAFATDDPATFGQKLLPRELALQKVYINPNPRNLVWAMVFDLDRPGAATAWEDALMPRPNWIAQNPDPQKGGRAHLGYILAAPVSRSEASRGKPVRYLARIQHAMTEALDADRAYSHRLTKNPIHPRWRTFWERSEPYELDELRDYLGDRLPLRIARDEAVGEGRNVCVFDGLRRWAYRARLAYSNREEWEAACRRYAEALNTFTAPLTRKEIHQIAKSVAGWCWKNITPSGLSAIQSERGKRSGAARASRALDLTADILNMLP